MNPLKSDEYPVSWEQYIEVVNKDPKEVLKTQLNSFPEFLTSIPPEKAEYSYAEGKWTIKEVIGHVIDTERIMAYRALCFARNDTQSLPGYDDELFVQNAHFNDYSLEHYAEEFTLLRKSNILLIESFNATELLRSGLANERLVSVRALIYMIAGHLAHHRNIIQDRYLDNI
ncbi:DinB family protein [Albibacterium sp.]|uniref:DinB family protein n=1 Tax=Albibacterium sp. TaxID=2952885 RepID=UPI002CD63DE7|nr:DinB family protein [Albibacterium sp.]HUH17617.1 DinB family protein [Albibacterium sp.]